ncbi:hypothetical protein MRX96_024329 [Rhipicephalus microplus]
MSQGMTSRGQPFHDQIQGSHNRLKGDEARLFLRQRDDTGGAVPPQLDTRDITGYSSPTNGGRTPFAVWVSRRTCVRSLLQHGPVP